jgi:hypothetical protein
MNADAREIPAEVIETAARVMFDSATLSEAAFDDPMWVGQRRVCEDEARATIAALLDAELIVLRDQLEEIGWARRSESALVGWYLYASDGFPPPANGERVFRIRAD